MDRWNKSKLSIIAVFRIQTFFQHFMSTLFFFSHHLGQSNLSNIPISPVLAALTLTAAILFAVMCIVLGAIYRRQSNR